MPRPGSPFRRVALDRRGELSDWIWIAPDIVDELGLMRDPSWFRAPDGPALLAQRATLALPAGAAVHGRPPRSRARRSSWPEPWLGVPPPAGPPPRASAAPWLAPSS